MGLVLVAGLMFYLNARLTTEFQAKSGSAPARVYGRPMELYAGLNLSAPVIQKELERLGYRGVITPSRPGEFTVTGQTLEIVTRPFRHWDGLEPSRQLLVDFNRSGIAGVRDRKSGPVILARLDPLQIGSIYPSHQQDRILVSLDEVPQVFKDGLLAVEDRGFYDHFGLSVSGIARALVTNVQSGSLRQGGSTLTQQLAKNLFFTPKRTLWRKGNEALMALLLEWHYSKDQILQAYINEVYLAQDGDRAIHGFGLAAQEFFGAPLSELRLHQQALLIGMVKGPSLYHPIRRPERATKRRNLILTLMAEQGVVTQEQADWASRQPLDVRAGTRKLRYPAYLDLVRRQLKDFYRPQDLTQEGLRVFTSLDPRIQQGAEEAMMARLGQLERHYQLAENTLQAATVVTQPETGEALAIVGGRQVRYAGFNRALDSARPVGSLLKPAIYMTALEQGYTLATPISDSPVVVEGKDGSRWQPQNFDETSHGDPILATALAKSYNQASARLGMEVGLGKVLDRLEDLGAGKLPAYPAVMLGAVGLSPLDVANVYGTFAANGFRTPVTAIRAVTDANDQLLNTFDLTFEPKVKPEVMHLVQYGLQGVMREGTGRYAYSQLNGELNLAGKTGTTNDQRDSWFAGYSGDYLAVVWIGRDDNGQTPLTGSSGALRLWTDVLVAARPQPYFTREPANIDWHWVDSQSGLLTKAGCEHAVEMPFIEGTAPRKRVGCGKQGPIKNWFKRWFN